MHMHLGIACRAWRWPELLASCSLETSRLSKTQPLDRRSFFKFGLQHRDTNAHVSRPAANIPVDPAWHRLFAAPCLPLHHVRCIETGRAAMALYLQSYGTPEGIPCPGFFKRRVTIGMHEPPRRLFVVLSLSIPAVCIRRLYEGCDIRGG
jgi:hypothetical protein